jgi:hypothetical protein
MLQSDVVASFSIFSLILDGDFCIVSADCVEDDSICDKFVCVGTQTSSKRNASVQTTQSLESVESEVQIGKSSSIPNRRIRNYIKYNKLENSEATKFSFDDESTQCETRFDSVPMTRLIFLLFHSSWRVV